MKVAGLFAGIGGLEEGLRRAGHETRLLCELDDIAHEVLKKHFADAELHRDVLKLEEIPSDVDLVAAGFPCQDLSQAGRTAGIEGQRSGLVTRVFKLLKRTRVPFVLLENVPNMLHLDGGRAMRLIVESFEALRYRWAYRVVDTRAFGLPQRRNRVFFLASREVDPGAQLLGESYSLRWPEDEDVSVPEGNAYGFYWTEGNRGLGWTREAVPPLKGGSGFGIPSAPAIWLRGPTSRSSQIVTPTIEDAEKLHGLARGWTKTARTEGSQGRRRWRLVGNAVSVPVAEWLGNRLAMNVADANVPACEFDRGGRWPSAAYGGSGKSFVSTATVAPVRRKPRLLSEFLSDASRVNHLSERAGRGFATRLLRSTLNRPEEFERALRRYGAECIFADAS